MAVSENCKAEYIAKIAMGKPTPTETLSEEELTMSQTLSFKRTILATAAAACFGLSLATVQTAQSTTAPTMDKYTAYPVFVNKTVPPDILFVLDISEAMLPAAYGYYPESSTDSTKKMFISSNVAGSSTGSGGTPDTVLCNTNTTGSPVAGCPIPSGTTDTFNSSKEYFGMFNPQRCYTYSNPSFGPSGSMKSSSTTPCPNTGDWDGNFLNWLTMRKIDLAKKALIGGNGSSAQCNSSAPFNCNKIYAQTSTGGGGSGSKCILKSDLCYRYVKATAKPAYPSGVTSGYYYPSTLPADGSSISYFGVGEGSLYVANSVDANAIFGASASNTFTLQVDLTSETTAVQADQSTGLFQNLRYDQMRVAVMFTNTNGVAGSMQMSFDQKLTSSVVTNIRNTSLGPNAPLAEALYEGLCYYKQNSPACYSNTPADYVATPSAQGDPYYFCNKDSNGNCATPVAGQMVSCCKGYVLMISTGVPTADGGSPNNQPFGNLMSTAVSNYGVTTTQLDDVAYYGKRNDLRSDLVNAQNVTFYSVNAMGGTAGGTALASASKWGGFEDSDGNTIPNATGQNCIYPPGSVLGTPGTTSNSSSEWDLNPLDCEPDTYFNANEGKGLTSAIMAAIQDILKKSASGTAASVLASSSTGEGAVYQAYFYPEDPHGISGSTINWTGYTTSFFIDSYGNFREDTDGDGRLVYGKDDIVRLRYDTFAGDVMVDRYKDELPADGVADSTTPYYSKSLVNTTMAPLWEAGSKLASPSMDVNATCSTAQAGVNCRRMWTWIDTNADGAIATDGSENLVEFTQANKTRLDPYLNAGASSLDANSVINFIRGCNGYASGSPCTEQKSLRDRRLTLLDGTTVLWPYGDPINSTPTVVGGPRERYDLIYGDASYTTFSQRYQSRRQMLYVGSNDGMLHAFNAGFYHKGDDTGPTSPVGQVEHGWFTTASAGAPTAVTPRSDPALGAELWTYIPYTLLPQLQWLARTDYTHVYYVDLKPKVTDVRIFADDGPTGRHPGGWGTILIGGFRFGGSCGNCTTGAPPMTYTAKFENNTSADRTFYSGYFVLDITDPEREPELIAVFTNQRGAGLTTSYPTIVRTNPSTAPDKTNNDNAKWFAVFGSGPTGYSGNTSASQPSQLYVLELKGDKTGTVKGPYSTSSPNSTNSAIVTDYNAFMGDLIAYDRDLDYRVDAVYGGNDICSSSCGVTGTPAWTGKMYRLTTGQGMQTDPANWGSPTLVIQEFSCVPQCVGTNKVGPVTAAPTVTSDDSNNVWVFFGTGRYWDPVNDKTNTDTQYFIGVKDFALNGLCNPSTTDCQQKDLLNISNAVICTVCASGTSQVTGVSGATTFNTLLTAVSAKKGWYTTLPTSGERSLSTPTLLGGTLLFTTFVPATDICVVTGSGNVYALFYLSGTAYTDPVIGTYTSGGNTNSSRSLNLGTGLPSSVAVQLVRQGTGVVGSTGGPSPCSGGLNAVVQSSTAALSQVCGKPALSSWSRYVSWMNNRDS